MYALIRYFTNLLLFILLVSLSACGRGGNCGNRGNLPPPNQWAWMGSSQFTESNGVYGTPGQESSGNIPGTREDSISWVDESGNLWLFGGYGRGARVVVL